MSVFSAFFFSIHKGCCCDRYRSKPREEQYLVKWASSQLHVNESLEQMVDPAIKKTISSKALSRFADIVSLCIQVLLSTCEHECLFFCKKYANEYKGSAN